MFNRNISNIKIEKRKHHDNMRVDIRSDLIHQPNKYLSLYTHTAKITAKLLRRRVEKKIEDVLGEDQFGLRKGKGTKDAFGMMRIIAERTLEIEEEMCVCFTDWQKTFDRVNWTKLMQVLKRIGIDWRERRLISKL